MRRIIAIATTSLMLIASGGVTAAPATSVPPATFVPADAGAQGAPSCGSGAKPCFRLRSTIAFSSTRDDPTANPLLAAEIYLIDADGSNSRRLTQNSSGEAVASLSPDGKSIVFDSNRNRYVGEPLNTSDLFLMDADGTDQTFLTRGSSATWSPDGKRIAFHASASGLGTPIRVDPGSATTDSDLYVVNVDDLLAGFVQPTNITNSPAIDDDPDWSPDGQQIVFTSHDAADDPRFSNTAEIYLLDLANGGPPQRLTTNTEEERAPAWSPHGTRILFSCRVGGGSATFELCVMNADGTGRIQLTQNTVSDLTATWSPDGQQIVFHRPGLVAGQGNQLFVMAPTLNEDGTPPVPTQLTVPSGLNLLAHSGQLRARVGDVDATVAPQIPSALALPNL